MRVVVSCPYPLNGTSGNAVTAKRIASLIGTARAVEGWNGEPADLLIALHAHRSRKVVESFPGPVVLLLTGTDIHEFPRDELIQVAGVAKVVVVKHEQPLELLPPEVRRKTRVIYPSVDIPPLEVHPEPGMVTLIGHLRRVKNPFHVIDQLGRLPLRLVHAGGALEDGMAEEARRLMREEPRYSWLGPLPRGQALSLLARSWVTLNTSLVEGAANVVAEAIALGVPVLASRIGGNIGLLGRDYKGLVEFGSFHTALGRVLVDPGWRERLLAQLSQRRPLLSRERERRAWRELIDEFRPPT